MDNNKTLNQNLADHGFTTKDAGNSNKHVLMDGEIVFTGDFMEVNSWLAGYAFGKRIGVG